MAPSAAPAGPAYLLEPTSEQNWHQACKLVNYLLSTVKTNKALLPQDHKKLRMFRGKKLVEALIDPEMPAKTRISLGLDNVTTEAMAITVAQQLLNYRSPTGKGFFWRVEHRGTDVDPITQVKTSIVAPIADKSKAGLFEVQAGEHAARYVWIYENSSRQKLYLLLIIAIVLFLTLYPVWPAIVRVGVWYLSVTLLLAILGTTVVQLTVFSLFWLLGYSFWILPNLWADDVPIMELFKPLYTFAKSEGGGKWYLRLAFVGLVLGAGWWASQQPTSEWEELLAQQKKLVDDLYAGTLLSDGSDAGGSGGGRIQDPATRYGFGNRRGGPAIPDIREMEKMWQSEDESSSSSKTEGAGEEAKAGEGPAAAAAASAADAAAEEEQKKEQAEHEARMAAMVESHEEEAASAEEAEGKQDL